MTTELVQLFAEFVDVPEEEIQRGVENFAAANVHEWARTSGESWADKAATFYSTAPGYVFDLIHGNKSREHLREVYQRYGHWDYIANSGQDVLEFGGGLGMACSIFRDLGRRVTYVDVAGPASQFARWYFGTKGYPDIEVCLVEPEELVLPENRQWDFVFSDSVIEHLIDPVGTVETLARAVKPGGLLYLIIDAHAVDPAFPMHRHIFIDELIDACPTLREMTRVRHEGDVVNAFRRQLAATPA